MALKDWKFEIIRHTFGSQNAYQIFVKEAKREGAMYNSLTIKMFKTRLEAIKYAKNWMRTH